MSQSISFKLVFTGIALMACFVSGSVQAETPVTTNLTAVVAVARLPEAAVQTYKLILQGGPFAHEKDGVVFGNRERLLPLQKRGYYREYTVATVGSSNRGSRRIVCGGPARTPDTCFYTDDHYASFRRIVP
jgi:ribonuclease T1